VRKWEKKGGWHLATGSWLSIAERVMVFLKIEILFDCEPVASRLLPVA